jgi:threonylcarbamoyladenosine tRNA methylthiotransferase MtaB
VLKIQDGCNHRCSYCVIPFVRGRSRSLPPVAVVEQVRELVDAGAREVVLSGINLGSWGRDLTPRAELRDLLVRLLDETSVERLRLSSIEPMDVTLDLVDLAARSPRLAPHFHVPLQSGSDAVLAAPLVSSGALCAAHPATRGAAAQCGHRRGRDLRFSRGNGRGPS